MNRHLGKNVVIVLALIAAGFLVAWVRFRPYLGSEGRFSDGVRTYDVAEGGAVRYAVWERPTPVAGDIDGPEGERRPALSPDGRWLVFTVGERGLGQDLYVAEMVDGQPRDPRPLTLVNSDADDAAPAFAGDALLFASDRIGTLGGLDLYRAPFSGGIFGEPDRLQGGLNSTADDTDPAPVPGSSALAFSSERGGGVPRHFDLFLARPAPLSADSTSDGTAWKVEPLTTINTGFQEREPAFTADGRHLFFASDREGGAGGFDLYRSALAAEGWVPPVALVGVNSEVDERAPLPSADGFELLLARTTVETASPVSHLERARSVELFRQPGRPVGWRELLVLGLLLLLALLAWLAKRWEELEVLYKCLLVSLVVHALLMWWFRDVYPESNEVELRGRGDRMRVRLVAQLETGPARNVERGGELEIARAELESEPDLMREDLGDASESVTSPAPEPGAARLVRRDSEAAAAPERTPIRAEAPPEAAAANEAAVAVRSEAEEFERRSGGAASLEVAELAAAEAAQAERGERAPSDAATRGETAVTASAAEVSPAARRVERARARAVDPPERRAAPAQRGDAPARAVSERVAVAVPAEAFERRAAGVGTFEVEAAPAVTAPERALAGPSRAAGEPARVVAELEAPAAPATEVLAVRGPGLDDRAEVPARAADALADLAPQNLLPTDGVRVALEDVESPQRERAAGAAPELELGAPRSTALERRSTSPANAVRRSEAGTAEITATKIEPSSGAVARLERPRDEALAPTRRPTEISAPRRTDDGTTRVAIEIPVEEGERVPPRSADVEAGLARTLTVEPLALAGATSREQRTSALPDAVRRSETRELEVAETTLEPSPSSIARLQRPRREALAPARRPSEISAPRRADDGTTRVAIEIPVEEGEGLPPRSADVEAGLARTLTVEPLALVEAPSRERRTSALTDAVRRSETRELEIAGTELEPSSSSVARQQRPPRDVAAPGRRPAAISAPNHAADGIERVAVQTPVTEDERRPAASNDVEAGLARTLALESLALAEASSRERRASAALEGPMRRRFDAPRPDLAAPEPGRRTLAVVEDERGPVPVAPQVARWEHTPYQTRSGVEKLRALDLFGGSEETEAAVAAGLAYLAGLQHSDGYWGSARDRHEKYRHVVIGKTGLAMLAFLGAGHTPGSGTEHAEVVDRAVDFLLTVQDDRTGHFGNCTSYGHGIATYALAECFALTGEERLRAPLESAVARILSQQNGQRDPRLFGGWGYYYPDGEIFDRWPRASVTAWQVMALESARLGGLEVPDRAFTAAKAFLENAWDDGRGAYRYSHDPSRLRSNYDVLPGSTPASLFALSLLGDDVAGPGYATARAFVMERSPDRYRRGSDDEFVYRATGNLYFWYYGTLAMFRVGGDPWRRWNVAMQETLLPAQEADGSWRPVSTYAIDYAGDDDRDRSYTTAMCVLSLEIYYRYFTPLLKIE